MASPQTTCSPKRRSRQQEKDELQHLNDRFVTYIDRVRRIREENESKDLQITRYQTCVEQETSKVKNVYESELQDARMLIDETAKEKARYQILASKHLERVEELEQELKETQKNNTKLQKDLDECREKCNRLDSRLNGALADKHTLQQRVKELEEELEELRAQLNELRESLEKETLSKVDLQNQNQSLKEELAFKKKVYEEELAALRTRSSMHQYISRSGEIDDNFAERLQAAIDEAREEIERETELFRQDLELSYKNKLASLESQCSRDSANLARCNHELRKANEARVKANQTITKLQEANECLENDLRQKEEQLAKQRHIHTEELARLIEEHRRQRESDMEKLNSYEELLDLRVQLEQEIKTLSALLHEEEMRLNLAPTPTREKRSRTRGDDVTSPPGKKSKFAHELSASSKADGYIQIYDVDPDGRYIQIKNTSDKIEPLGGFRILHEVLEGDEGTNEFSFSRRSRLQGGSLVTVWGSKAEGAVHNPPTDIIWRSKANWGSGPKTTTKLYTKNGKAVATFTQRKEVSYTENTTASTSQISSQRVMEMEESDAGVRTFPRIPPTPPERVHTTPVQEEQPPMQVADEQVFHQQGDPAVRPPPREERCTIS